MPFLNMEKPKASRRSNMEQQMDLFEWAAEEQRAKEEKEREEDKLTDRQEDLLELIKYNSLVEKRKTTQLEIYQTVPGYKWNDDVKAHDHCPAVWSDINKINFYSKNDYIIISKDFSYWIGDYGEAKQFITDLWDALLPRLCRHWKLCKKLKMEDQYDIFMEEFKKVTNDNHVGDENGN